MGGGGGGGSGGGPIGPANIEEVRRRAAELAGQAERNAEINELLATELATINARDTEKISGYLDDIIEALQTEIESVEKTLFGGSVSKNTYVEGLSDIDALVILDREGLGDKTPADLQNEFERILDASLKGRDIETVRKGELAVTLRYRDGTEIQLLPAIRRGDRLAIASADGKEWRPIHPRSFAQKLSEVNGQQGGQMIPALKLAKAIIGNMPSGEQISGYHAEALAVAAFQNYSGPRAPKTMVAEFFSSAKENVLRPIKDVSGQSHHVDEKLGDADSSARRALSAALGRIARATGTDSTATDWAKLLGHES
jgi:predicted nucleotidyltransferase